MWFFDKISKKKPNKTDENPVVGETTFDEVVVADEYELEQSVQEVEEEQTKELNNEIISTKDLSTEDILAHLDEGDTQEFNSEIKNGEELEFDITKTIQDEEKLINLIEDLSSEVEEDENFVVTNEPVVRDPFSKYESRVKKIVNDAKKK